MIFRFYLLVALAMYSHFSFSQTCEKITVDGEIITEDHKCNKPEGSISVVGLHENNNALEYQLKIGNNELYPFQDIGTFTGLDEGEYTLVIRDKVDLSCTLEIDVSINAAETASILNIETQPATCNEGNGSILVNATGRQLKYRATKSDGTFETEFQNENLFENLPSGRYMIEVKEDVPDIEECIVEATGVVVDNIGGVVIEEPYLEHTSCGNNDGYILIKYEGSGNYDFALIAEGETIVETDYSSEIIFSDLAPGNYEIYIRDRGILNGEQYECVAIRSVTINESTIPTFDVEYDSLICSQGASELRITNLEGGVGIVRFALNDSNDFQDIRSFTFNQPGVYKITAIDESRAGCRVVVSKEIELECEALFPEAFLPNNNGKNDLFEILYGDKENLPLEIIEFSIYNRVGNLVHQRFNFTSDNKENWWTGEGYESDYYTVVCNYVINGETKTYQGTVYLLR